jgi:hypothetical protein
MALTPLRPTVQSWGSAATLFLLCVSLIVGGGVAVAFWLGVGAGTATAAVGNLGAPTAVSGAASASNVTVTWTASTVPSGATLSGYYVVRNDGTSDEPACDSDEEDLLPVSPTSCVDLALASGTYTYTVVAVLNSWTATSAPSADVVVVADPNAPTMTLDFVSATGAWLGPWSGQYRIYFKQNLAGGGGLSVTAAVTDTGSGPASATFPALGTTGWTNSAEVVTSGSGSAPTITYTSQPWTFATGATVPTTKSVIGADTEGNTVTRSVSFRRDISPPTGGALRVNGVTASAGPTGNTSGNSTGSFLIDTRTDYTEIQSAGRSGLESSVLTRQSASLVGGVCGTFGPSVTITGAPAQGPLPTGCYRYQLLGTDRVGNTASRVTTVRVDTTAPVGGALTVNGTAAAVAATQSLNATGTWTLSRTEWTDADSGMTSSTLTRASAPIVDGACGAFGSTTTITGTPTQTGTSRTCYRYVLTGTNGVGGTSTISTIVQVGPFVTSVALVNGPGIAGRATQGDQVIVTYSDAMNPSSFCSSWSGSGDQVLNGNNQVAVSVNQAGGGDTLTVSATGCTFNFGSIALGSTGYTTSTATFVGAGANRSTITWTAATRTLTITLGATASSALGTVASSTATYTPSTSQQNTSARLMGGTFATGNVQQF